VNCPVLSIIPEVPEPPLVNTAGWPTTSTSTRRAGCYGGLGSDTFVSANSWTTGRETTRTKSGGPCASTRNWSACSSTTSSTRRRSRQILSSAAPPTRWLRCWSRAMITPSALPFLACQAGYVHYSRTWSGCTIPYGGGIAITAARAPSCCVFSKISFFFSLSPT